MQDARAQSCRVTNVFEGSYAKRFTSLCMVLETHSRKQPPDWTAINSLIADDLEWLSRQSGNELDRLRFRSFLLILRDLLSVSWQIHYSDYGVEIVAPPVDRRKGLSQDEQYLLKAGIRHELSAACLEQLTERATQDFIRALEEPSPASKNKKSIRALIADGQELANRLRGITSLEPEEQVIRLEQLVRPYLVLVKQDERDPFTGIKYGDIWRYFRLTWSIPNVSSPGRKLFYLVRDAAHPNHAIMAIAGLSNVALQVRDRDDYIGWTAERVIRRLKRAILTNNIERVHSILSLLERHIERGLQDIDLTGFVNQEEVNRPDEAVLRRLQAAAEGFSRERQRQLRLSLSVASEGFNTEHAHQTQLLDTLKAERTVMLIKDAEEGQSSDKESHASGFIALTKPALSDEVLEWDEKSNRKDLESRRQLILKKRALTLYQLLYARRVLQRLRETPLSLRQAVERSLGRDDFRAALTYATFSNKREKAGINMLEITTCGAIAPYNHLLGGKLVALLLLSPQVGSDYRTRYGRKHSWISSQIKGEKVYRDCDLVFLSTTSLYSVGSSQYNRLYLPAETFHPQQPRIEYKNRPNQEDIRDGYSQRSDKKYWQTSGYGTVHFSSETSEAVVELGIQENGFREVNSIFGEGFSPKLRKIRAGLMAVGLDPEVLLRHNQPRLLYCIELCPNGLRFLNGEDVALPEYIAKPEDVADATEKIAEYWRRRWLISRLHTPGVLDRVTSFASESFTLQLADLPEVTKGKKAAMTSNPTSADDDEEQDIELEEDLPSAEVASAHGLTVEFLQKLYLNQSSYSDLLDEDVLNALHIPTPLDSFIMERIAEGCSVVLTGNAGDGKTHLIKRLRGSLANACVIEDASVLEPDEIIQAWRSANKAGVPFCMAANEWPLYQLISKYADQLPVLREVNRQLKSSLVYDNGVPVTIANGGDNDRAVADVQDKIVVINLGLRNPLSPQFFEQALNTLLQERIFASCSKCEGSDTCDAVRNRRLLMEYPRIRQALTSLIDRVAVFGRHVTVRELFGFLSYAVFGGRNCDQLSREYGKNDGFYSQQIFSEAAQGTLFTLLRQYLDPARTSHPKWDNRLYSGYPKPSASDDWTLGEVPIPPSSAKSQRNFTFLKRRFFFEHAYGYEMLNMLTNDEIEFAKLLDPDNTNLDDARDQIVDAINAYFCPELAVPQQNIAKDLIVWSAHSYDERVVRAFASWFFIERWRDIRLHRPRLAPALHDAFAYRPDHLHLVVFPHDNPIALLIDFDLYHTLMEVQRGLPSVLVDEGKSVRLLRFMSRLEARRPVDSRSPFIRSYTVQGRDLLQIEVDINRKKVITLS